MGERDQGTYQMLWDCPYCDTKKLLGLTHRHCPSCGAPQDPLKRYFPKDEDKIAVENHAYVGADRICPACDSPNSAKSAHCVNCGSPMEGTREVDRQQERAAAPATPRPPASPGAAPTGKRSRWAIWLVAALVVCVGLGVLCTRKEEVRLSVTGHEWKREIRIEALRTVHESEWCDQLPSGAYNVSRSREIKRHTQEPDGESCHSERKDNGDGTFSEKQVCKTKYRQVPVYADKCRFDIEKWVHARDEVARGSGLSPEPRWPVVTPASGGLLAPRERPGARVESYIVRFKKTPDGDGLCEMPLDRWRTFPVGSSWVGTQSFVGKTIDCAALKPVP